MVTVVQNNGHWVTWACVLHSSSNDEPISDIRGGLGSQFVTRTNNELQLLPRDSTLKSTVTVLIIHALIWDIRTHQITGMNCVLTIVEEGVKASEIGDKSLFIDVFAWREFSHCNSSILELFENLSVRISGSAKTVGEREAVHLVGIVLDLRSRVCHEDLSFFDVETLIGRYGGKICSGGSTEFNLLILTNIEVDVYIEGCSTGVLLYTALFLGREHCCKLKIRRFI